MKAGEPFAFVRLRDSWKSPEGKTLGSFAIITTSPNGAAQCLT